MYNKYLKNRTFPRKQQKSLTHLIMQMQILLMFPVGSAMLYV